MPIVDPDPAGMGTYLVAAVLLALGIAIFLYTLIREARANRIRAREVLAELPARVAHPNYSKPSLPICDALMSRAGPTRRVA